MPRFRVEIVTGLPPVGHVFVNAPDSAQAETLVKDLIDDLEITSSDDRILFDLIKDPQVLTSRPATVEELDEDVEFRPALKEKDHA